MYTVITRFSAQNRVTKCFRGFDIEQDAIDKLATVIDTWPDAFVAEQPSQNNIDWLVDPVTKTLSFDPLPIVNNPNISFDDFVERFTTQEWDDTTDLIYAVNTVTGLPKNKKLIQGLARVQAHNSVDLSDGKTDAFLSILVSGGVITEARKTQILTP